MENKATKKQKPLRRAILFSAGGMITGLAYAYFIGCRTGSCPITSNPITMMLYTGLIGWLLSMATSKEQKEQSQ